MQNLGVMLYCALELGWFFQCLIGLRRELNLMLEGNYFVKLSSQVAMGRSNEALITCLNPKIRNIKDIIVGGLVIQVNCSRYLYQ